VSSNERCTWQGRCGVRAPRASCWTPLQVSYGVMPHPDVASPATTHHFQGMSRSALLSEILDLPAAERLQLVEEIWDSLAASVESVPVPEWHRTELDRRLDDPSEKATISWEEVQAGLRKPKP
jgi:putative addiction module component (TIGR02574 family)